MSEKPNAVREIFSKLPEEISERLLVRRDLSGLSLRQLNELYKLLCESLELNPLTQPFLFMRQRDPQTHKEILTLYAARACTDQLASKHRLSRTIVGRERIGDTVYAVTARIQGPEGRIVEATGAVNIGGLKGDALANAVMKAETKAFRRGVLAYCGLGFVDESELETMDARVVDVEMPLPDGSGREAAEGIVSAAAEPEELVGVAEPAGEAEAAGSAPKGPASEEPAGPAGKPAASGKPYEGRVIVLSPPEETPEGWRVKAVDASTSVELTLAGDVSRFLESQAYEVRGVLKGGCLWIEAAELCGGPGYAKSDAAEAVSQSVPQEDGALKVKAVLKGAPKASVRRSNGCEEKVIWAWAKVDGEEVILTGDAVRFLKEGQAVALLAREAGRAQDGSKVYEVLKVA